MNVLALGSDVAVEAIWRLIQQQVKISVCVLYVCVHAHQGWARVKPEIHSVSHVAGTQAPEPSSSLSFQGIVSKKLAK